MKLIGRIDGEHCSLTIWGRHGFGEFANGLPVEYLVESVAEGQSVSFTIHGSELRGLCDAVTANRDQPYYPVRQ